MEYRALFRSELKQEILLRLLKGDKRLSELKAELESTETTILHVLKEFRKTWSHYKKRWNIQFIFLRTNRGANL